MSKHTVLLAYEKNVKGFNVPPEFIKVPIHEANKESEMSIFVILNGEEFECKINRKNTVEQLKSFIQDISGIPV